MLLRFYFILLFLQIYQSMQHIPQTYEGKPKSNTNGSTQSFKLQDLNSLFEPNIALDQELKHHEKKKKKKKNQKQEEKAFTAFMKDQSNETGFFLIKMLIQKYQKQIKESVLENCVYQIDARRSIVRSIQYFYNQLKNKTYNQIIEERNAYVFTHDITIKYRKCICQLYLLKDIIKQLMESQFSYIQVITHQMKKKYKFFLPKEQNQESDFFKIEPKYHAEQYINEFAKFYTNISYYLEQHPQMSLYDPQRSLNCKKTNLLTFDQLCKSDKHLPAIEQIILFLCKNFQRLINYLYDEVQIEKKVFQAVIARKTKQKEQNQLKNEKQLKQANKKTNELQISLKQANQKINCYNEKIKIMQNQLSQAAVQNDALNLLYKQQQNKRSSIEQQLSTFLEQQIVNVENMLNEQSVLNLQVTHQQFSCDESSFTNKYQQKDSIQEWSIINDLIQKKNNSINAKTDNSLKSQLPEICQSEFIKIKENVQNAFKRIKSKIFLQNKQRQQLFKKAMLQRTRNKTMKQSQIEMQHLKIQVNFAKEEKQTAIKKLAEKCYQFSQVNANYEQISKELETAHLRIGILEQSLKRQIQKTTDLQKIVWNNEQIIEELNIQIERISLNKEGNQEYLKQKTQQFFNLKSEHQNNVTYTNLQSQKLREIQMKMNSLQTEKQILLLTNGNLHRQIQNLKEKRKVLMRVNFEYQSSIQEIKKEKSMIESESLILQKVTKVNQSIQEV